MSPPRLFSDGLYVGITLTADTFAKPAEPMAAAIKRLMAARKRALKTVRRDFPKFIPGMTTATYVQLYYLSVPGMDSADYIDAPRRPAPCLVGPEVEETQDA